LNQSITKWNERREKNQQERRFLTIASTGQRLLSQFVLLAKRVRSARSRTNRANPLRGTGLPVKQMLERALRAGRWKSNTMKSGILRIINQQS